MADLSHVLRQLEPIVKEAGRMAQAAQKGSPREIKPDGSIVTPADRAVEEFLRGELRSLVPGAGVYGEEMGCSAETEEGLWCIDPIDGTSNYAFGLPIWGVSVGLVKGEECLVGIVYLPVLDELFTGAAGLGAFLNGERLPPIPSGEISAEELVSCPDRILRMYPSEDIPGKIRHSGAFVADAVYTVCQRVRGLVGVREKLYDIAACLCIAKEVGADIRYADGSPLELAPLKQPWTRLERAWIIFPPNSGFHLP
ncbi:MAG TPA: inositol monophosphatase family protein [Fimbriimonadaceae bacterium]|nr:inositol monophosphatase family protein [Fimbriimonadaceae bacterium]